RHLADLNSYAAAQSKVCQLFLDPDAWSEKAIKNVGSSGMFSSDRAIMEYASQIWGAKPCSVS
ncbi:MAG TPA: glycogen/starch/alpha-glucan phosphorylase, partial [Urbifossiella sp.]